MERSETCHLGSKDQVGNKNRREESDRRKKGRNEGRRGEKIEEERKQNINKKEIIKKGVNQGRREEGTNKINKEGMREDRKKTYGKRL